MNARVRLDATSEYRDCSELSGPEKVRVCGSDNDWDVANWCDKAGVFYRYRDIYSGPARIDRVTIVLMGRDVAAHLGHYDWTDDYDEDSFVLTPPAGHTFGSILARLESLR